MARNISLRKTQSRQVSTMAAKRLALKEISQEEEKNYVHMEASVLRYCAFANRYILIDRIAV